MNPNPQSSHSDNQMHTNPAIRPPGGNPPLAMNNPVGMQQMRPMRMELPNPNIRMENNYQQIYQQRQQQQQHYQQQQQQNSYQAQRNMYQNYSQGQRPPVGGEPGRFPPNHTGERQNGPQQNMAPGQPQGQAYQMGPRYPGSQPLMRPQSGNQNHFSSNQLRDVSRPPNLQQMDPSRGQSQINPQKELQSENHRTEAIRDPNQTLSRRTSNLDEMLKNNHQKLNETEVKPQPSDQAENNGKPTDEAVEKNSSRPPVSGTETAKSELGNSITNAEGKEVEQNSIKSETKSKSKTSKEKKKDDNIKDDIITAGMVGKNIKFFEENDTAKTPLIPNDPFFKKKEGESKVSSEKGKCQEGQNEGGVDETPMIHPNLKSIYQEPRKVARIPQAKSRKFSKKSKLGKKSIPRWPFEDKPINKRNRETSNSSELRKSQSLSRSPYNTKRQQKEKFGPEEELLAFFENSNSFRKLKRDDNRRSGESATKVGLKPTTNGDIVSPKKTPSKLPGPSKKNPPVSSPTRTPLKSPGTPGSKSLPKTPETPSPPTPLIKKVPMNKIQVGAAPSPNLKAVRSKVGSLANTTHKPGGGNVKVETHKIDFSKAQPRIEAKNLQYAPSGGEKKITQVKLQWSAQSKVGSLENATYKPGGGDKKIESVKLDFKEKAKPKVGSKDNVKHTPGGGNVKIENQKLEFKAQSKVGSLDNVKHKPGGGDIKIFDDKTYLKQISGSGSEGRVSGTQSYGDLSVVREVEGRSAPGTPGRKTAVKIKKITTIQSSGDSPMLKNVTEVTVVSQTPKKSKNVRITPTKEQVKLTYSKIASSNNADAEGYVGLIKIPANENAPILKSNLSRKDVSNTEEKETLSKVAGQVNGKRTDFSDMDLSKEKKNLENFAHSSGSPNLSEGKLNSKVDTGMSKFLQDEMATHEKVGEIWKEMNTLDNKSNFNGDKHRQSAQDSYQINYRPGNPQSLSAQVKTADIDPKSSNFNSNQNMQPQNVYRPPVFNQTEQNYQMTQQRFLSSGSQQQGYRIPPQQQHQPPNNNAQF